MTTELLVRPARSTTGTDDPDLLAHYANKDKVTEAYVLGTPIVALCGYEWIPSRDPDGRRICPECKEIYESLPE